MHHQAREIQNLINKGEDLRNAQLSNNTTPANALVKNLVYDYWAVDEDEWTFLKQLVSDNLLHLPNEDGYTVLHISCMLKDLSVVKSLLSSAEAKLGVNAPIGPNSAVCPGYTPLHFAAHCKLKEIVLLLLENDADILARDAKGLSALSLCVSKFRMIDLVDILTGDRRYALSGLKLTDGSLLLDVLRSMGTLEDWSRFLSSNRSLLKGDTDSLSIPSDSPIWPGLKLHQLVLELKLNHDYYNELALRLDLTKPDSHGSTPLHLLVSNDGDLQHVESLLDNLLKTSVDAVNPANLSHLHIACLWERYDVAEHLLGNGSDPNVATLRDIWMRHCGMIRAGSTPLHTAVRRRKAKLVKLLLEHGADGNIVDADGASPMSEFLYNEVTTYVCFPPSKFEWLLEMFLNCGGQSWPSDVKGIELLYKLLGSFECDVACRLLYEIERRNLYGRLALTKLHIACALQYNGWAKQLLDSDAQMINAQIPADSPIWPGDTALHILCRRKADFELFQLLLNRGADQNLRNAEGCTPFQLKMKQDMPWQYVAPEPCSTATKVYLQIKEQRFKNVITFSKLVEMKTMPRSVWRWLWLSERCKHFEKLGITRLHIACALGDVDMAKKELISGAEVNRRIPSDSPVWPGFTALHLLLLKQRSSIGRFSQLLMAHGADPTLRNAYGKTPIYSKDLNELKTHTRLLTNFTHVNPTDNDGLSHFHLCCMAGDLQIVKKFIDSGVDINMPTKGSCAEFAGWTPLHFAALCGSYELWQLLISHGANVDDRTADGLTPMGRLRSKKKYSTSNDILSILLLSSVITLVYSFSYFYGISTSMAR